MANVKLVGADMPVGSLIRTMRAGGMQQIACVQDGYAWVAGYGAEIKAPCAAATP